MSSRPQDDPAADSVLTSVAKHLITLLGAVTRATRAMSTTGDIPGVVDGELMKEAIQAAETITGKCHCYLLSNTQFDQEPRDDRDAMINPPLL